MTELHMPQRTFWQNLRDFPSSLTLAGVMAGFLAILTAYSGPILIVIKAAEVGKLTEPQTATWIWAIAMSNSIMTIFQSLYYRQPITAPWSTAGAALLVTALPHFTLEQAVGAYVVAGVATFVLGLSGLFGRVMRLIPTSVVLGLIAGILLSFGMKVFSSISPDNPIQTIMVVTMIAVFFILKRVGFRAPTLGSLLVGGIIAGGAGLLNFSGVTLSLMIPQPTLPVFDANAIVTIGLPLFALGLTSQYAPGQAVLRSSGYEAPIDGILTFTGFASIVSAFFGCPGPTLGALTAAMVTSPEPQPDINKRYASAIASGLWYFLFGLFGATILAFFGGFPKALVDVVAGLALTGTITSSLTQATADANGRDAGIAAFLCTASGMSLFGIGAPFWGLVIGVGVSVLLQYGKTPKAV